MEIRPICCENRKKAGSKFLIKKEKKENKKKYED